MNECNWYDLSCSLTWLLEGLENLARMVFNFLTTGIADLIDLIPYPSFLDVQTVYTVPGEVSYWLEMLQFQQGFAIFTTAYVSRFILRRIL